MPASPAVHPPARPPLPTPCSTGFSTKHCSATLLAPRQRSTTFGRAVASCCLDCSSDGGAAGAARGRRLGQAGQYDDPDLGQGVDGVPAPDPADAAGAAPAAAERQVGLPVVRGLVDV